MPYCPDCGAEVTESASFCAECGEDLQPSAAGDSASETEPTASAAPEQSATSPLAALLGLWVLWFVAVGLSDSSPVIAGLLGFSAVVVSLPLLYVDAKNAAEADELEVNYPIAIPVAMLLLWVVSLPAYLLYRWSQR